MDHPLKVLFIGGTGRSGSNVLRARLAEHGAAASLPFEARFTVDPDGVLPAYRALRAGPTPFEMHRLLARLERLLARLTRRHFTDRLAGALHGPLKRLGIKANLRAYADWELERSIPGFSAHAAALIADLTAAEYPAIWPGRPGVLPYSQSRIALPPGEALDTAVAGFLTRTLRAIGPGGIVDDNTYNLFFAPELAHLLPGAHLVHILRDPCDVVASLLRQRWTPSTLPEAIRFYDISMTTLLRQLDSTPPERVTVIRLEDLAADPMPVMEALYGRLDLHPERQFTPEDFAQTNAGRWRRELDAEGQRQISDGLAGWVERFGYDA